MSTPLSESDGLFFASILYHIDYIDFSEILKWWSDYFGPSLIYQHPYFPMAGYYAKEMGNKEKLQRKFVVSCNLRKIGELSFLKLWAYKKENNSIDEKNLRPLRPINIDVGVVTDANLQLSTFKPYNHRIALQDGVYSDLTYICVDRNYQKLPWTYPDYAHDEMMEFFNWCRRLALELKK